ncbi:11377_t:CDS:2, partial [Gigaspora margarita]
MSSSPNMKRMSEFIRVFESDEPLFSHVHSEWQLIQRSVDLCDLEFDFKSKVSELIDKRFNFVFHPAMAIANLLDSRANDLEEVIIPYLENAYELEIAANVSIISVDIFKLLKSTYLIILKIFGVIQKYIAKVDEFSMPLLWASVEYLSPI